MCVVPLCGGVVWQTGGGAQQYGEPHSPKSGAEPHGPIKVYAYAPSIRQIRDVIKIGERCDVLIFRRLSDMANFIYLNFIYLFCYIFF